MGCGSCWLPMATQLDQLDTGIEEAGLPTLVRADGSPEFEYSFCLLEGIDSKQVQVILIAVVDEKYLVAVPTSAWHRVASKRPDFVQGFNGRGFNSEAGFSRGGAGSDYENLGGICEPCLRCRLRAARSNDSSWGRCGFWKFCDSFCWQSFCGCQRSLCLHQCGEWDGWSAVDQDVAGGPNLHERVGKLESTLESMATDFMGQTADPEVADRPSAMRKTIYWRLHPNIE